MFCLCFAVRSSSGSRRPTSPLPLVLNQPALSAYTPFWSADSPTEPPLRDPLSCRASRLARTSCGQGYHPCDVAQEGLVALLAEDANRFLLGLLPKGVGFLERVFASRGEPHQPRPAVLPGTHLQQPAPHERLEVAAQCGAIHGHPLGQLVDGRSAA